MNILISGGSDGIGLEILKLLRNNHNVVIISPNKEKLEKVSKEYDCDYFVGDVSNWEDCKNAVLKVGDSLDVLINNAGLEMYGELEDSDPLKIKKLIEVNYLGMVYLTKAAIPYLKKSNNSLIININSQASNAISTGRSVYYSSKYATHGFTKNIAKELATYGIKVSGIYPGAVDTKFSVKAGKNRDMSDAILPLEVAKSVKFIIEQEKGVMIPELGIKNILN